MTRSTALTASVQTRSVQMHTDGDLLETDSTETTSVAEVDSTEQVVLTTVLQAGVTVHRTTHLTL